jgi:nucleoside-diphosphate-sugar epimerase
VRILVTGATGFIASAFIRRALRAGDEVLALVRSPERAAVTLPAHPALTVLVGTLAEPPWTPIERFGVQTCVHAAWITHPGNYRASSENWQLQAQSIALASGLFERGVRCLVTLGTCEEYVRAAGRLDETRSALGPTSAYARAKHELRLALEARAREAGACLIWPRIFQPYGLGEHPARLPSLVIRRLRTGEPLTLQTPRALRDWIHVDDVATALLSLVQADAGGVFNVGTGTGHTVEHVALAIASRLGRADLVSVSAAGCDRADSFVADATRLRRLGWAPRVDLDTGLAALIEQIR